MFKDFKCGIEVSRITMTRKTGNTMAELCIFIHILFDNAIKRQTTNTCSELWNIYPTKYITAFISTEFLCIFNACFYLIKCIKEPTIQLNISQHLLLSYFPLLAIEMRGQPSNFDWCCCGINFKFLNYFGVVTGHYRAADIH